LKGSITTRETYRFEMLALALVGIGNERLTRGFAPVVVPKTLPSRKPTSRTPSSKGEIPMAVTGTPATSSPLTSVIVSPRSAER
jgi:hypothetical protein